MSTIRNSSFQAVPALAAVTMLAAGCASAPPSIVTGPDAEITYDGLHEVRNSRADEAWARPGIDISQYSKIILQTAGIEYRPGGESGRRSLALSRGGPYEVTERQKERLRTIVREEFLRELARSERFELVTEPGRDVLLVRGALLDVVSFVPPEPIGSRSDVYLSRVGEATLVLELRDSISEAILARVIDRRAAEPSFGLTESNRITNEVEIRRVANSWARSLRQRLDEVGSPQG